MIRLVNSTMANSPPVMINDINYLLSCETPVSLATFSITPPVAEFPLFSIPDEGFGFASHVMTKVWRMENGRSSPSKSI
jgi:hypothetical protein